MNEQGEQESSDSPGWFVISLIVIVVVAIALVILAVIGLVASLIVWAIIEVVTDHDNAFRVIGENAGPFGAWAAAIVGLTTVAVLAKTNRTRAREAVRNDFREFMQWALENLNQNDDIVSRLFAFEVVKQFAETPPKFLDQKNKELAAEVHSRVLAELEKEQQERNRKGGRNGRKRRTRWTLKNPEPTPTIERRRLRSRPGK
ncbi:hypothetical protein ACP6NG_14315 [Brevibacterium casei]|uniref:hypothetical protein n=1 Tax=Brevibacterium casei TaxID=33889 RepID=UPI00246907DA|nr:hypothetical protein [Brevibacterium casei]MDH5147265.1 hypothetical protein [Brevibacterium casei]